MGLLQFQEKKAMCWIIVAFSSVILNRKASCSLISFECTTEITSEVSCSKLVNTFLRSIVMFFPRKGCFVLFQMCGRCPKAECPEFLHSSDSFSRPRDKMTCLRTQPLLLVCCWVMYTLWKKSPHLSFPGGVFALDSSGYP